MTAPQTCTIIATNYLAQARVLARSFAEHHPGSRLQVLVIDDVDGLVDPSAEPFDLLRPDDLSIPPATYHEMAACYEVIELATALKPSLLTTVLERCGGGPTVYLDPDILVLAPLDDVADILRQRSIVLTPHTAVPMPRDGLKPTEFDILASGVWNLGFIAVSSGAEPFLSWWEERLRLDALVDHANMRFTDQRWVDFAPAYFDVYPLRDPGFNVAYWNADHRRVEREEGRYRVDGRPLRFFHFSGFNPDRPYVLSKHQADCPRVVLSEQPAVAQLCELYASLLNGEGLEVARKTPYGWARLPDGTELTPMMRRAVHRALVEIQERPGVEPPPDPFDPKSTPAFLEWLASPDPTNPLCPEMPRVFWEMHCRRQDLQRAFPFVGSVSAPAYRSWMWNHGRHQERLPRRVVATAFGRPTWPRARDPQWASPDRLFPGYLVTGYLRAELGLGEAARRAVGAMRSAGLPHSCRSFELSMSRMRTGARTEVGCRGDLNTNVLWINADQLRHFVHSVGRPFFEGRYTVGAWAWETQHLPQHDAPMEALVDEVWAPSEFSRQAMQAVIDKPVYAFPHPVVVPDIDVRATRSSLGMPVGFSFLFIFDFFSTISRKNPVGLIEAFSRAFSPGEGPSLIVKTINGHLSRLQMEQVRLAAADRTDIVIMDGYLPPERCAAMVALADCYVSLHRAEGFGLTMADAMALGTPVIATGYSGNLEFMDEDIAYLVPYELTAIRSEAGPYPYGGVWAQPDLDAAADLMCRVYERPEEARRVGREARRVVLSKHGSARAARFLTGRFEEIQERLREGFHSNVAEAVGAHVGAGS